MNTLKLYFIIFILSCSASLYSQETNNYSEKFINLYSYRNESSATDKIKHHPLLSFYSVFISSQDHTECPFYPSCSVYMSASVHQRGLFLGVLKGLDRLSRCNRLQEHQYELTYDRKMIDLP